jgi:ubiquinone/menaquinone biosynthesis C-methylase UbiE
VAKRDSGRSKARHLSGWWGDFFPAFRPVFDVVSKKVTSGHVKYVTKKLNLIPGSKFLDCACGIGRIGLPLAKRGVKVTGIDITQSYLDEFDAKAKRMGLKVDLHNADMRRIDFHSEFDAAGNLWTSFGYFERESDNLLTLKKMHRALKPGGKVMLHLMNRDWFIAKCESTELFEVKDTIIGQVRKFDYERSVINSIWYVIRDGKKRTFPMSLRLYSYHELIDMFKSAGFVDIEGYGSMKDEPISRERGMMFVIGAKPGKR